MWWLEGGGCGGWVWAVIVVRRVVWRIWAAVFGIAAQVAVEAVARARVSVGAVWAALWLWCWRQLVVENCEFVLRRVEELGPPAALAPGISAWVLWA